MKRLIIATAVAAVLFVTGCGSSSTTSTPTTTAAAKLTKAQLIEKGDAICKDYDKKSKDIPAPKAEADLVDYLDKSLKLAKEQLAAIKALGEPSEDAAAYKAALDMQSNFIDSLEKKIPEFKKDPSKISSDAEMDAQSKASNKSAQAFGFKECGKGSSGSSSDTTTTTG